MLLRKAEFWANLGGENILEVMRGEVHHQEYALKGLWITGYYDIEKLGGEYIIFHSAQLMHNLDFSDYLLGCIVVGKDLRDVLDGHDLPRFLVLGLDYLAEGTLANEVEDLVLVLDVFPDVGEGNFHWIIKICC